MDFGYTDEKIVLHNSKIYAEPGQKITFVGSTGAGKTTITNLLNRFYDIQDGKIRYDGININKIKKSALRRSRLREKIKAKLEVLLLCRGYNINKLHGKIQNERLGSHLFE